MRLVRLLSTFFMATFATACDAQTTTNTDLDYDQLIQLDAENLAEAGIGEAYLQLLPELRKYVSQPARVEELIDPDLPRYAIRVNGTEYVIYSPGSGENEGASWGPLLTCSSSWSMSNSPVQTFASSRSMQAMIWVVCSSPQSSQRYRESRFDALQTGRIYQKPTALGTGSITS